MEFLKIVSYDIAILVGLLKLYFQYKKNPEGFNDFFNNRLMDGFLVVMTGLLSFLIVVLGYMTIWISNRPFDILEYGAAIIFLNFAAGLFFIVSCNLWSATIVLSSKITKK